jgi:hypothetical protein
MAYSIDQMKGLIASKGGVANPTVYRVQLPSIAGVTSSEVNLLCTATNLPGKQIATYDRLIGGKTEKVAYRTLYGDVNMTFLLLNDYGIRDYFDQWTENIVDPDTYEPGYKSEYAAQIKIEQLKKGIGLPVYSTPLGLPLLPSEIQNRLPSVGPADLARGQLDLDFITDDKVVYEVTLENAFPTTIQDVNLSNSLNDQILEFSVTFSYTKYSTRNRQATPGRDFGTSALGTILTRL